MPPTRGPFDNKLTRSLLQLMMRGLPPSSRVGLAAMALRRDTRRYGAEDYRTLETRIDYDVWRHRNGDSMAAEADLADLIARFAGSPPPVDRLVYLARQWRGQMLTRLGRLDDAERVFREVARDVERDLGRSDRLWLNAREARAGVLHKAGLCEEAEAELADVVALRTAADGADAPGTVRARLGRAELLSQLGRVEDSERAWRELAEMYERQKKRTDADALIAQEKHAIALYRLGQFHEAAAEFVRLAGRLAATRGVDHPDTVRVWKWRDGAIRESAGT